MTLQYHDPDISDARKKDMRDADNLALMSLSHHYNKHTYEVIGANDFVYCSRRIKIVVILAIIIVSLVSAAIIVHV
jgi:hypothetical protein